VEGGLGGGSEGGLEAVQLSADDASGLEPKAMAMEGEGRREGRRSERREGCQVMRGVDTQLALGGSTAHVLPVLPFLHPSLDTDFAFPDDETFEFMMDEVAGERGAKEGEEGVEGVREGDW